MIDTFIRADIKFSYLYMLKKYFVKIWRDAHEHNIDNIISLLEMNQKAHILDVGCGDGRISIQYKNKIQSKRIVGVDGVRGRLKAAKKKA